MSSSWLAFDATHHAAPCQGVPGERQDPTFWWYQVEKHTSYGAHRYMV